MAVMNVVSDVIGNVVAAVLMLILAVLSFFVTVFIVSTGAQMAGFVPAQNGNFVILSATILVASAILSGMWSTADMEA